MSGTLWHCQAAQQCGWTVAVGGQGSEQCHFQDDVGEFLTTDGEDLDSLVGDVRVYGFDITLGSLSFAC